MKYIISALFALTMSTAVLADGYENGDEDEGTVIENTNRNVNRNYNTAVGVGVGKAKAKAYSNQRQYQGQHQGQGQIGINEAVGSGNTTDVTIKQRQEYEEAAQGATSPGGVVGKCLAAFGVGLQTRGFGLSFGANRARKVCEDRELAAMLWNMGRRADANEILTYQYREWLNRVHKSPDTSVPSLEPTS